MAPTTFDIITSDRLVARKAKDSQVADLLSTLVGAIEKVAKDDGNRRPTEEDTMKVVKKFVDSAKLVLTHAPNNLQAEFEIEFLTRYLPKQLTKEEIIDIIMSGAFANIGSVMGYFQTNYPNQYDAKIVSSLAKDALAALVSN